MLLTESLDKVMITNRDRDGSEHWKLRNRQGEQRPPQETAQTANRKSGKNNSNPPLCRRTPPPPPPNQNRDCVTLAMRVDREYL